MEKQDDWLENVEQKIGKSTKDFTQKQSKRFKPDKLARVGKRLAEFSEQCEQCRNFKELFEQNVAALATLPQAAKEERKRYLKNLNAMVKHLQNKHRMVEKGQNIELGTAVGVAMGVAVGSGSGNIGLGIILGIALGFTVGSMLDGKAQKEGRVI